MECLRWLSGYRAFSNEPSGEPSQIEEGIQPSSENQEQLKAAAIGKYALAGSMVIVIPCIVRLYSLPNNNSTSTQAVQLALSFTALGSFGGALVYYCKQTLQPKSLQTM
jgi:hypothetical protein